MKVYISPDKNYTHIVKYVLKLIENNLDCRFEYVSDPEVADRIWDNMHPRTEVIAHNFYSDLFSNDFNRKQKYFQNKLCIENEAGQKDILAGIFYMVNCLQEYNVSENDLDQYKRFKYTTSYQARFNNNHQNLVQDEIDSLGVAWQLKMNKKKSNFFISHDIDTIYGSILQDGFWAVKNFKPGVILKLIMFELAGKPHWKNIDRIIKIHSEYDIKSTFFWIVNKGQGLQNIKNADYHLRKEQKLLRLVEKNGFVNGLHKSCSDESIDEELDKTGIDNCTFNRYHFLRFLTHDDWGKISDSRLNFDCSLGFAEHYGFRNSYGKAFQPFDFRNNRLYNFVEAPLHFMDGTFHKYMKIPPHKTADIVIDMFEKNPFNCNFSLLWHNNYFTDYKYHSFLKEYKKILGFIYENKIQCLTPQEIIKENTLT